LEALAGKKNRGNLDLDLQHQQQLRESKMAALMADKNRLSENLLRLTQPEALRQGRDKMRQPREKGLIQGNVNICLV
jgi:hypothetical protein